jgi:hypothetical protein
MANYYNTSPVCNSNNQLIQKLELDKDYEFEEYESFKCIYIEDLFFELWVEIAWDIDIVVNGVWSKEDRPELSQEELDNYENILAATSEILTPKHLLAIYFFSRNDAETTKCPDERKRLIIQEMAKSNDLCDYEIIDFKDFCHKIDKIDSKAFLDLTNILYDSKVIGSLCNKPSNNLEEFERLLELITNKK